MKKEFRKKVLALRKKQNADEITQNSSLIFDNLCSIREFEDSNTVMVYLDFNNEVKTDKIIKHLLSLNKRVLIPITILKTKELIPSQIMDIENETFISTFGIREPKREFIRKVNKNEIDLVIVPGVAFDKNGYRLGYGGGFYDKFLSDLNCITVGIAFEFQIFDCIPKEDHDIKLDYIVSEKRVIKIRSAHVTNEVYDFRCSKLSTLRK
ncbi:5-formyltetrahydrofolate cyclo-ligase [Alkalithermobacter paradoxus]|uniref:5-formyltetrahydrofolate cyclo-ligase n=1 Tax=Alkalithermobacter paradoxus TaxID=29349 RepID=A0A1V4I6K9_9FIRM|nr:putative 5-formyltetrahydrofolate cyclo-ligase [[Clostridium] thermoalcaliphilum]